MTRPQRKRERQWKKLTDRAYKMNLCIGGLTGPPTCLFLWKLDDHTVIAKGSVAEIRSIVNRYWKLKAFL